MDILSKQLDDAHLKLKVAEQNGAVAIDRSKVLQRELEFFKDKHAMDKKRQNELEKKVPGIQLQLGLNSIAFGLGLDGMYLVCGLDWMAMFCSIFLFDLDFVEKRLRIATLRKVAMHR